MIILIILAIGLILLVGSSMLFYKRCRIYHLLFLFSGLAAAYILINNEFFNVLIPFIIAGATAGYTFKNNKKVLFYILISSLTISLISIFNHYYLSNIKNIDILKNAKDTFIEFINESNISDQEKNQLIQNADELIKTGKDVIPFLYFLNAFFDSIIGIWVLNYIFKIFKKDEILIDDIEKIQIKEHIIFVFIAAWLMVLLLDRTRYYYFYFTGLNTALILSCIYLVQSFGIVKFFLVKRGLPFWILAVVLIISLILSKFIFLFIIVILSSIGAIDFYMDFRKLKTGAEK